MRAVLAAAVVCLQLAADPTLAEPAAGKEATIRALIEVTGADQIGRQVMEALFAQLKPLYPTVPAETWTELSGALSANEMTELVVPVYAKHFEADELEAVLAFYQSPAGQKMLATMPAVMQESVDAANAWGQKKAAELLKKLTERGFEPAEA